MKIFNFILKGILFASLLMAYCTSAKDWIPVDSGLDVVNISTESNRSVRGFWTTTIKVKNNTGANFDNHLAIRLSNWSVAPTSDFIFTTEKPSLAPGQDAIFYANFPKDRRSRNTPTFDVTVEVDAIEITTPRYLGQFGDFNIFETASFTGVDSAADPAGILAKYLKIAVETLLPDEEFLKSQNVPVPLAKSLAKFYEVIKSPELAYNLTTLTIDALQEFNLLPSVHPVFYDQSGKQLKYITDMKVGDTVMSSIVVQTAHNSSFTNPGSIDLDIFAETMNSVGLRYDFIPSNLSNVSGVLSLKSGLVPLEPYKMYLYIPIAGDILNLRPPEEPTYTGQPIASGSTSFPQLNPMSLYSNLSHEGVAMYDSAKYKFKINSGFLGLLGSGTAFINLHPAIGETLYSYPKFRANDGRTMEVNGSTSESNLANYSVTKTVNLDSSNFSPNMMIGDVTGDANYEIVIAKANKVYIYDSELNLLSKTIVASNNYNFIIDNVEGDYKKEIILGSNGTNQNRITIISGSGNIINSFVPRTGTSYQASGQSMNPEYYLGNGKLLTRYNAGYSRDYRGFGVIDLNTNSEDWYYDVGPIPRYFVKGQFDSDAEEEFITAVFTPHNGAKGTGKNGVGTQTYDGDLYLISVDENGDEEFTTKFGHDTSGGANGHTEVLYTPLAEGAEPSMIGFIGHYAPYYPGQSQFRIVNPTTGQTTNSSNFYYNEQASIAIADIDNDGDKEILALSLHSERGYVYDNNLNIIDNIPFGGTIFGIADLDGDNQKEYVLRSQSNRKLLKVVNAKTHEVELSLNIPTPDFIYHAIPTDANKDGISEIYLVDKNRVMKITE